MPITSMVSFCDVLIATVIYGFEADPASVRHGHVFATQGDDCWLVACSFEEVVAVFLTQNDNRLLNCL